MTREEIVRMAQEAGGTLSSFDRWSMHTSDVVRFSALVAAAEREACAKVCEIEAQEYGTDTNEWYVARACAVLIHSRGK